MGVYRLVTAFHRKTKITDKAVFYLNELFKWQHIYDAV